MIKFELNKVYAIKYSLGKYDVLIIGKHIKNTYEFHGCYKFSGNDDFICDDFILLGYDNDDILVMELENVDENSIFYTYKDFKELYKKYLEYDVVYARKRKLKLLENE